MTEEETLLNGAIKLCPNNFTELSRTPWAGKVIGASFKNEIVDQDEQISIGESWEFSCDPKLPSILSQVNIPLPDLVRKYPEEVIASDWKAFQSSPHCEILIKLLDAAQPLSVQVHPSDDDPNLKSNECGKPESWLILAASPGAGIYLGFSRSISKKSLREALTTGKDIRGLLNFVPVKAGDYFNIPPGVTHAVGAGVTLLEPQRIINGKSGKTYRMWDWNRTYDETGALSDNGKARELHIEESLLIIDPERQHGNSFVTSLREKGRLVHKNPKSRVTHYGGNHYYSTYHIILEGGSHLSFEIQNAYGAMVILDGGVSINSRLGKKTFARKGQPLLLPNKANPYGLEVKENSVVILLSPEYGDVEFSNNL